MPSSPLKPKKLSMLAMAASAVLLSACGGGGGGSGPLASANTLTGVAVDGYLQGATVFLDLNLNGVQDTGEPATTTGLNGRYALDYSSVTGGITGLSVVVTGGVDSDTGFAFVGKLTAPVESASQGQVVTPLTTLVDAMVAHGEADDVASAKQKVANALGLNVDQLATDPVAAMASQPGLYTTAVTLQRSIQMLASANATTGESSHESQERVIRALASAIRAQTSAVDVGQLVASVNLSSASAAQALATAVSQSVRTGLDSAGHDGAKAALRAMDEVRTRMESDHNYSLSAAADKLDEEHGKTTSRPYHELTLNSDSTAAVNTIRTLTGSTVTTRTQPASSAGRLLASNCFQCHGTGGKGGFEAIQGHEAAEIREYLGRAANSSIMTAHAQGYTSAQLDAIIAYLQQQ
ncbi:MAG: cytochrome c [Pseudomonadota bacterium]